MAEPVLLPLPPPAPVLIPARHPPRTPAVPASTPLLRFLLRAALATGTALGVTLRRFAWDFAEEVVTTADPFKIAELVKRYFTPASAFTPASPSFLLLIGIRDGGRAEVDLRQLLEALLRRATVQAVVVVVGTLMLIHLGGARRLEEEDQEQAVGRISTPRPPPPAPLWLPHHRLDNDLKELVRIDRIFKDKEAHTHGLKKTELGLSSFATEILSMVQERDAKAEKERQTSSKALTKTSKECEGSLKTEYTKFEATHDKFCKDKAAHVKNFKDPASVKRIQQLHSCLNARNLKQGHKIADAEVSLKKMKQGNKSISMVRKAFAPFLGRDDGRP